jgi:hypothetical protein
MKKWMVVIPVLVFITMLACKKESSIKTATLNVRLTDAPAVYDSVIVEIISVMVHSDQTGWVTMSMPAPGRYDLLRYTNGLDTLIATTTIPAGQVSQIRLILGTSNTITKDGVTYPLIVPSGAESGLKLQIHKEIIEGVTNIIQLDFDAGRSIVEVGNGTFHLKPVIRTITAGIDGSIRGAIQPFVSSIAYAFAGADTFTTPVSTTGDFLISGVPAGTYTVCINPDSLYNDTCISNVVVTVNSQTNIGTIVF